MKKLTGEIPKIKGAVMFNIIRNHDLHEVVCQSVQKDQDTFSCEMEKEFFLCMLKHFLTIHDFNNFNNQEMVSETYNKFYREIVSLHFWDMDNKELELIVTCVENTNAS